MIKKLIKQYITCKHKDYKVIRKIYTFKFMYEKPVMLDRRECKSCDRKYYSNYYINFTHTIIII